MRKAIPQLDLDVGDRHEPSADVPDHGIIDHLTELPPGVLRLVFWRPRSQSLTYHRNPLFSAELGLEPSRLMGDTLHALYLGVFQVFAAYAFRFIADNNVFRAPAHYTTAGKFEHNLSFFERALKTWYEEAERRDPHCKITQIDGFTVGMVKTEKGRPKMRTKAA